MNGDLNYTYDIVVYSNGIFSNFFLLFNIYFILILRLITSRSYLANLNSTSILEKDNYTSCSFLFETYDGYLFSDIFTLFLW